MPGAMKTTSQSFASRAERANLLRDMCRFPAARAQARKARAERAAGQGVLTAFAPDLRSVARARQLIGRVLRERGCQERVTQDAALIVSELAANAVLHAGSRFSVGVEISSTSLRVAVSDGYPIGSAERAAMVPRRMRGLGLVDALAARWGVEATYDGKTVWAELPEGCTRPKPPFASRARRRPQYDLDVRRAAANQSKGGRFSAGIWRLLPISWICPALTPAGIAVARAMREQQPSSASSSCATNAVRRCMSSSASTTRHTRDDSWGTSPS